MRDSIKVIASVVVASLAVAACATSSGPRPLAQVAKMKFYYPIGNCKSGTTTTTSYTMTLGANFSLTNPMVKITPKLLKAPRYTALDIATTVFTTKQPASISIVLDKNSGLSFPGKDSAGQDLAFEGAGPESKIFCGAKYTTDPSTLTFTVLYDPSIPYANYILGLVAADQSGNGLTLPIFIDPGIDNQG